jgi:hypothetical protein
MKYSDRRTVRATVTALTTLVLVWLPGVAHAGIALNGLD